MNKKPIAIVISISALTFTLTFLFAGNTAASAPTKKPLAQLHFSMLETHTLPVQKGL